MTTETFCDVAGRNAIVTGGALGIGFAIAERFTKAGANCLIVDKDAEALAAAVSKLAGSAGRVVAFQADIADKSTGSATVDRCVEEFGSVDILINNAGIFPTSPVLDMSVEFLEHVLAVNIIGLVLMSKAVGNQMKQQKARGRIVNIASIDSVHPSMIGLAAYDTSKGGVLMFTKSFALEMAQFGVNVNAIAPGGIATEGASAPMGELSPEQMDQVMADFVAQVPLSRIGTPDEIARVAQFLASDGADYMTGSLVTVDGGRLLM